MNMKETTLYKKCNNCEEIKPLTNFEKDKRKKTGYTNRCYTCKYRSQSPENVAVQRLRYRSKRDGGKFNITPKEFRKMTKFFGGKCAYCQVNGGETTDHIIPVAYGGSHTLGNLIPACRSCNSSKGTESFLTFADRKRLTEIDKNLVVQWIALNEGIDVKQALSKLIVHEVLHTSQTEPTPAELEEVTKTVIKYVSREVETVDLII